MSTANTSLNVKVSGAWKRVLQPHVKISGVWYPIHGGWIKVSGVWKRFYGGTDLTTTLYNNTTPGAWSYTVGDGEAGTIAVGLWGPGGGGQDGWNDGCSDQYGIGGGGGGWAYREYSVEKGDTISGTLGSPGTRGPVAGTNSTQSTFKGYSMQANCGSCPAGGSASGGTTNLTGEAGGLGNYWDGGAGPLFGTRQTTLQGNGIADGGGGAGGYGIGINGPAGNGANPRVNITKVGYF